MNFALCVIKDDFGPEQADTISCDLHPAPRSDYVLTNPPFNESDWFRKGNAVHFFSLFAWNGERTGVRCRNDLPPKGNPNFAWPQNYFQHPAPQGVSSDQSGAVDILRYKSNARHSARQADSEAVER